MSEIMLCVFVNVAFFHETVCLRDLSQSVYINLLHSFNCCISRVRPGHDLFVCPINEMRNGKFLGFFFYPVANHGGGNFLYLFVHISFYMHFSIFQDRYLLVETEFHCCVLSLVFSVLEFPLSTLLSPIWESNRKWVVDSS